MKIETQDLKYVGEFSKYITIFSSFNGFKSMTGVLYGVFRGIGMFMEELRLKKEFLSFQFILFSNKLICIQITS